MATVAIPKGVAGAIPPNLGGIPKAAKILPGGVSGLVKNAFQRAPKFFGVGLGLSVAAELLFPQSTAKTALSEIDPALLYPPSSETIQEPVYPFLGGQGYITYVVRFSYKSANQKNGTNNRTIEHFDFPIGGRIDGIEDFYDESINTTKLVIRSTRENGDVARFWLRSASGTGIIIVNTPWTLNTSMSFAYPGTGKIVEITPNESGDTGENPPPIIPPVTVSNPGFTPLPLSTPTTPTEAAKSSVTRPNPTETLPANPPIIGSRPPARATDTGGSLGSPYAGTKETPTLPSILPSTTASNSGGLTTTRTRVEPNLSEKERPLTTTTVETTGGTATASSSTSPTLQKSLGTPLPSQGISVSNGAQTGVQVSTPTTATTTSVTQTPPATETVNLNPDFDWSSIITPLLVGSYGTSQFRSEVKTQTEQAICNSTGTGGCVKNDVFSPLKSKLDDIFTGLGLIGEGANLSLSNSILNRVTDIQNQVNSPSIGLQATRNFLNNAWNSTIIDKSLNAANFVLTLHNSVLLSTNVAETVLQTLNVVLDIFGVTDAEGNSLDIAAFLTNALNKFATGVLGAETVTQLGVQLTALNRIYQAGMNILDNVTDLADTIIDLDEQTGENVAKIGNALRRSGSIDFNAYDQMVEDLDVRRRSKWLARLDAVEDLTDTIYAIADNIRDIKDIGLELKDNRNELATIRSEARTALTDTENQTETDISALPEPTESDELEGQESG